MWIAAIKAHLGEEWLNLAQPVRRWQQLCFRIRGSGTQHGSKRPDGHGLFCLLCLAGRCFHCIICGEVRRGCHCTSIRCSCFRRRSLRGFFPGCSLPIAMCVRVIAPDGTSAGPVNPVCISLIPGFSAGSGGRCAPVRRVSCNAAAGGSALAAVANAAAFWGYNLLFVALLEELGWRGFLLDRLQSRFSRLVATLLV